MINDKLDNIGQVDVKGVHTFIMFRPNFVK